MKISPWIRCKCGKLHVVELVTTCPNCGRLLSPFTKEAGEAHPPGC